MTRTLTLSCLLTLAAALVSACPAATTVCVPGKTVTCACVGGGQGAQACTPDGSGYGACDCGGGSSSGGSSGGTTGGSSGGSGGTTDDAGTPDAGDDAGFDAGPPSCVIPTSSLEIDPCASQGLACNPPPGDPLSKTGTCTTPQDGEGCDPSLGCITGDVCEPLTSGGNACFQTCSRTLDCTNDPATICETGLCQGNYCGPNAPSGVTLSGLSLFGPCDASGKNDGTCLPMFDGSQGDSYGLCWAGTTLTDAGPPASCGLTRGSGTLCPSGTGCFIDANGSVCLPFCDQSGTPGGPVCAFGSTCAEIFEGGPYEVGLCVTACAGETSACPSGESCQGSAVILADGGTETGCLP